MNTRPTKSKPLWSMVKESLSLTILPIALGSALFATIEKIVDSVISNNYAIADNPITAASAYLFIGGWFGLLVSLLLGKVLGQYIPGHTKISLPDTFPTVLSISAGIASGFATLLFLWGNQLFDLSIMVAISNGYVLMIVIYEWMVGKIKAKKFLLPGLITVVSTIAVAFNSNWTDSSVLQNEAGNLLLIFLGFGLLVAFDRLVTKPAVDHSDPINVQIVRFAALAVTGTVSAFGLAIARQELPELMNACLNIITSPAVYILLLLLFAAVFLGQVLELWAKKVNVDVSSIVIVIGLNVGLGFVASLVINAIVPGSVGEVPSEWITLVIRSIGVVGLIFATVLLQYNKNAK